MPIPLVAVRLDAAPPTIADVAAVAAGARVELGPAAVAMILASRAVVDRLVNGDTLIYGLNTGLGHMRNERVSVDELRDYQVAIVAAHDSAIGEPLPTAVVRAAMFVRLAGIARGGSGASPGVARQLVGLLNAGIHPVVPAVGSVGASDLMHMAAIGAVMLGGGRAEVAGEVMPGAQALARAGLEPVVLEPKDGLALISANGVSIGAGALVAARAARTARAADLVLAVSLEATRGNPSVIEAAVAVAKPVPGQAASAAALRAFLAGSDRWTPAGVASVQDPLSFRVGPQVHGAFREFTRFLTEHVTIELAASDDNPLVVAGEDRMISNGNFHPIAMALAADALRPAAAHIAQLSDRRMNHLWTVLVSDPALLTPEGIRDAARYGGPLLRYAAAARTAELRALADPVTLDIGPLDLGVEDHATNAPFAVLRSDEALDLLQDVLAVELLIAAVAVRRNAASLGRLGSGTAAAVAEVDAILAGLGDARDAARLHRTMRDALLDRILAAAEAATSGDPAG